MYFIICVSCASILLTHIKDFCQLSCFHRIMRSSKLIIAWHPCFRTGLASSAPALGHFCTDGLIYNQPTNDRFTEHQVLVMKGMCAAKKINSTVQHEVTYVYFGLGMVSHSVIQD